MVAAQRARALAALSIFLSLLLPSSATFSSSLSAKGGGGGENSRVTEEEIKLQKRLNELEEEISEIRSRLKSKSPSTQVPESQECRMPQFPTSLKEKSAAEGGIFQEIREKEILDGLNRLSVQEKVGVDAVELMKMFYDMFFNKERQRPIFLITYGPPGSGKSWILNKVARQYNYDLETNFVQILQDDMIKSIGEYQEAMDMLSTERPDYTDKDGNLDEKFYKKADQIYWKYRNMVIQMKKMLLDVAYRQELNIVYETTGSKRASNPSQSLFNHMREARQRGYKIIIVYPYVANHTLMARLDDRNKKQNRVLDPRLAKSFVKKAQSNWYHYLTFADYAYVYDNNIDKSNFGRQAPWLMKYRIKPKTGEKDFKCHVDICEYPIWKRLIDEHTDMPICAEICKGVTETT
ncbi:hypothetical protein AAMO2058_000656300 [Amorphochlora amoebiformis]